MLVQGRTPLKQSSPADLASNVQGHEKSRDSLRLASRGCQCHSLTSSPLKGLSDLEIGRQEALRGIQVGCDESERL